MVAHQLQAGAAAGAVASRVALPHHVTPGRGIGALSSCAYAVLVSFPIRHKGFIVLILLSDHHRDPAQSSCKTQSLFVTRPRMLFLL